MFQDAFDAAQGLDHVRPVIIQVPELAVVALVRPPALLWRDLTRPDVFLKLSRDHEDGVAAAWAGDDAIDASRAASTPASRGPNQLKIETKTTPRLVSRR